MIKSKFEPATSRYDSHMGTCNHCPAVATAWITGGARVEITAAQYPNLEPSALVEKAVAMLRAMTRRRSA
jgi:hypothetical protein